MILLFLLPFYDRGPERRPERRPIATAAGIFTIAAMAYLTYLGAAAGSPNAIDMPTPKSVVAQGGQVEEQFNAGQEVAAQSGCLACHKFGENGNAGPGPHLTDIGGTVAETGDRTDARQPDGAHALLRGPAAGEARRARRVPLAAALSVDVPEAPGTLPDTQVRAMFDRIAGFYDLMNSVMTAGLHHRWRARAADLADVRPGDRVLDVATGTGDLAIELATRIAPAGEVVGSDFSDGMLERAREKDPGIRWEHGDALALPYGDGEFRAATVGFGARNFGDLAKGIGEMARVVAPGGKVVVLEITTPTKPPLSTFFSLWFDRVIPLVGKVAADSQAYSYLPSSVRRFPGPEGLGAVLVGAGLTDVRWILTAGGIIALHVGTVPTS